MKLLFWLCTCACGYTYIGYPVVLWARTRRRKRPLSSKQITPSISIVIAARNEESNLPRKLKNLRSLHYPAHLVQIIIASDGSTDGTVSLLRQFNDILPVILETSSGKALALNEAVRHATGDILVFFDTRQTVDLNALEQLVSPFGDPEVGAVSGELLLEESPGVTSGDALGIYWKIEKAIRKFESESGSVVGVTGAIYAVRRELYVNIPAGTILDDVFIPMAVVRQNRRVVFQPTAIARDRLFELRKKEFERKVRTHTGNYQLIKLAPWLLTPANPILLRFISHKMLRLVAPLLLLVVFVTSAYTVGPLYRGIFVLQMICYLLAAAGALSPAIRRFRIVSIPFTFAMLNVAAVCAFYNFIAGRKGIWA